MKNLYIILSLFFFTKLSGQQIADFEGLTLPIDTFDNGASGSGGFRSGNIFLPNTYSADFDAWMGWALSSKQDTMTAGFQNQYSCISGSGAEGSNTYAVGFGFDPIVIKIINESEDNLVTSMVVNNATYPYLSMRDGDGFSKKFGGVTGTDPDFFLLTIKGFQDGGLKSDSINFYLADFRSGDPLQDYLVSAWQTIDLTSLGLVDSLQLSLSSTDVGIFGMNTPAYFCIDNIITETAQTTATNNGYLTERITIFPNPAQDYLVINQAKPALLHIKISDLAGCILSTQKTFAQNTLIKLNHWSSGLYFVTLTSEQGSTNELIMVR